MIHPFIGSGEHWWSAQLREDAMLDSRKTRCPWCGERFEVLIDSSAGAAEYVEDCPVCCRPITMQVDVDADGELIDFGTDRE